MKRNHNILLAVLILPAVIHFGLKTLQVSALMDPFGFIINFFFVAVNGLIVSCNIEAAIQKSLKP